MALILALDEGTTSARAILFDADGSVRGTGQYEYRQIFPQPGWVEHDASEIWTAQTAAVNDAIAQAGISTADIAAIGITNQRETTVVWDRSTGQPITNAIVWQDRRTAQFCDQLKANGHEANIQQRTGLMVDAYFSGSKLRWILDNVPGARAKADSGQLAFGTIDSWLIWKLTNGKLHITDSSNASRTMLFNIHKGDWDADLLDLFRIPRALLPRIVESSAKYGVAEGALAGIPIAGIAGDQQSALFGQMCLEPGMAKNTYGTGCFLLQNTGTRAVPSRNRLLTTVAWTINGKTDYALEGSVFIGGAVVQWLRDGLGLIQSASEVEALAASVPDNGGIYMVPAFAGLGAPHWDQYARGSITGITRGTNRGHFARAALESIAYQVADLLQGMRDDAGIPLKELRVDGGAVSNNLLMQFQADILGIPVVRPAVTETTALGAAYLAGLATGYWTSPQQTARQWREEKRFEPRMSPPAAAALMSRWSEAVERAKNWEPRA